MNLLHLNAVARQTPPDREERPREETRSNGHLSAASDSDNRLM